VKREEAINREISKKIAEDKKMNKKEKDERYMSIVICFSCKNFNILLKFNRVLWKKNEVADYEATTFAIFYNNALYLAVVIGLSFFLLKSFTPAL